MVHTAVFLVAVLLGAGPKQSDVPTEPKPDAVSRKVNDLLKTMATAQKLKTRSDAADKLIRLGKPAVPALVTAMKHETTAIRYHAIAILGGMRSDAAAAVPALVRVAKSPKEDAGVRQRAIYSLGEIRADEKRSVPFLLETFLGRNADLDELAGEALGKFGPKAKGTVPGLVAAVKARKGKLELVVHVLGKIGREAKAAIPALKALSEDARYKELQPLVRRTLAQIR